MASTHMFCACKSRIYQNYDQIFPYFGQNVYVLAFLRIRSYTDSKHDAIMSKKIVYIISVENSIHYLESSSLSDLVTYKDYWHDIQILTFNLYPTEY